MLWESRGTKYARVAVEEDNDKVAFSLFQIFQESFDKVSSSMEDRDAAHKIQLGVRKAVGQQRVAFDNKGFVASIIAHEVNLPVAQRAEAFELLTQVTSGSGRNDGVKIVHHGRRNDNLVVHCFARHL